MFRELKLTEGIHGKLFLHKMPGRDESSLEQTLAAMREWEIDRIFCLTSMDEILIKSPAYGKVIQRGGLPCERIEFTIRDYSIPQNQALFRDWLRDTGAWLLSGEHILLHCAGGRGRTGLFACCLLQSMGILYEEASLCIHDAGCRADTREQADFMKKFGEIWRASNL
ncbi:MAG: hypothetical protein WCG03_08035 [Kiritimatiellales bacterium]